MANCRECMRRLYEGNASPNEHLCANCYTPEIISSHEEKEKQKAERDQLIAGQRKLRPPVQEIMLTTETAPNLNITKRIEIVTAEVAYGMNIFKDLFASVRDVVGGRSEAVQATMRDARRTALYELKKEAHAVGANAVVGVDLDYVELSSSKSMVMLVASGTAVIVEE